MKARPDRDRSGHRRKALATVRERLMLVTLTLLATSLVVFGVVLTQVSSYQSHWDLGRSLEQSATAFRSARSRDLEQLGSQVGLLAEDPRLHQYRQALALVPADSPERASLEQALQEHLEAGFRTAGGDLLVLIGADGRVQAVARPESPPREAAVEPSEATSQAEGQEAPDEVPGPGQPLGTPMVDAVFGDGQSRAGCLRLRSDGPLYTVALAALRQGKRVDGVLFLAERVTEKTLAEWAQNLSDGIVLAVSDRRILAAHDRRAGRRPSPAMLNSLEEAVARWEPPDDGGGALETDRPSMSPGTLEVGGRPWLEVPVALSRGEGRRSVGWVLFLGDTSGLEDAASRETWLLIEIGLGVLVVGLGLAWFLVGWVLAPLKIT